MKQWKNSLLFLFLTILVLAACASEPEAVVSERDSGGDAASVAFAPSESSAQSGNISADMDMPAQPLIIRTGNLGIVVEDTDTAVAAITSLVNGMEGWVVSSNLYTYGGAAGAAARRGEMTVRVPVTQFDTVMNQIKTLALEVPIESSSGQDVTEEYVDLTARLSNLEATATRVRNFLDEAKDVEDALAVNQELSRLESEIEQLKGRMNYLSQSASFSTIQVDITPDVLSQPIEIAGWRPQGVAKEAIEDLVDALQGLADFLIWFVIYALPLLLIVGAPLFFITRAIVRATRKRRQPITTPPES